MPKTKDMTPKQQKFVAEYAEDGADTYMKYWDKA